MNISQLYRAVGPITSIPGSQNEIAKGPGKSSQGPSEFQQILDKQLNFSRHAETRIRSREINWNNNLENRISKGIDSAEPSLPPWT